MKAGIWKYIVLVVLLVIAGILGLRVTNNNPEGDTAQNIASTKNDGTRDKEKENNSRNKKTVDMDTTTLSPSQNNSSYVNSEQKEELDLDLLEILELPISIEEELKRPIKHSLPDVSKYSVPFESSVSLAPLKKSGIKRVSYKTDIVMVRRFIFDGQVSDIILGDYDDISATQSYIRELVYEESEREDQIAFKETIFSNNSSAANGKGFSSKRVLNIDGRYMEETSNPLKKHYKELEPKFPNDKLLQKGSKWTQEIAVDPELNPDGKIKAEFEVLETFIKSDQRYMRIQQKHAFNYDPNPLPPVFAQQLKTPNLTCKKVCCLSDEVYDLNLSTGVKESISDVRKIVYEMEGLPNGVNGLLMQTSSKLIAESIEK